ncbi:MAG: dTDP-4-dehydrorhamnose 3,5-epimerase [Desulfamplus sp.]|nr:dTDP-4-dehydrorhamnose 3,5-epimerase [Desulfamplus sp.]MBF0390869.1 dTDP-4-dehydrorhamnose 3,5-epimerase [Desulfamplus sp.]
MVTSFNSLKVVSRRGDFATDNLPELEGVLLIKPDVFADSRGFFLETWQRTRYQNSGVNVDFVQDNHSRSKKGVIRGLHYQLKNPQAKLVYAVRGTIFDVAVDIRRDSPMFGMWAGAILSDENRDQLFIPAGFAHGFAVLSEFADVTYKCSDIYTPGDEYGIIYNDPDIAIDWHLNLCNDFNIEPLVSDKDGKYPKLCDVPANNLSVCS